MDASTVSALPLQGRQESIAHSGASTGEDVASILEQFGGDTDRLMRWVMNTLASAPVKISTYLKDLRSTGITIKSASQGGHLTQLEKHGQAAILIKDVEALPLHQAAIVLGYYDPDRRNAAIDVLVAYMPIQGFPPIVIKELIREYLSGRSAGRQIKKIGEHLEKTMGVKYTRGRIQYARNDIYRALDKIDEQARRSLIMKWS